MCPTSENVLPPDAVIYNQYPELESTWKINVTDYRRQHQTFTWINLIISTIRYHSRKLILKHYDKYKSSSGSAIKIRPIYKLTSNN